MISGSVLWHVVSVVACAAWSSTSFANYLHPVKGVGVGAVCVFLNVFLAASIQLTCCDVEVVDVVKEVGDSVHKSAM